MIKTGKAPSIKDLLAGYTKTTKEALVASVIDGKPTMQIEQIVDGNSAEYGYFIYVLFTNKTMVAVPAASLDTMRENVGEDFSVGSYGLVMEKSKSKNGRDYFTCYVDLI